MEEFLNLSKCLIHKIFVFLSGEAVGSHIRTPRLVRVGKAEFEFEPVVVLPSSW
jgi:hypothetical protein